MVESFPFAWYVEPEILRREQDLIFRQAWQYVGHVGEFSEDRRLISAQIGELPVLVRRDHDGSLVASADGSPAAVAAWGPFVFANLDPNADALAGALASIPESLRTLGIEVETLVFHHRADWELETNWKIACENFLECYHCPVAHPGFSALVDVAPDAYRLACDGLTSSQYGPARGAAGGGPIDRSEFHFLWPNTGLNVFPGAPNLSIGPILPAGPERTRRYLDYFFAPETDDGWIAELLELDDLVGREDTALVEGVQRGVRSRAVDRGALLGEAERLVAHFQQLTAGALGPSA